MRGCAKTRRSLDPEAMRAARRGLSMVEFIIAMPIVVVAASMFFGTIARTNRQVILDGEVARATDAMRSLLEQMRNERLQDVLPLYNEDPFDDPLGPGTAPGSLFEVEGLIAQVAAGESPVGRVFLPVTDVSETTVPIWELREDKVMPELGMPRDLSRDNIVDSMDHSADYAILPVRLVVLWEGQFGPRRHELSTLLTELRYR